MAARSVLQPAVLGAGADVPGNRAAVRFGAEPEYAQRKGDALPHSAASNTDQLEAPAAQVGDNAIGIRYRGDNAQAG